MCGHAPDPPRPSGPSLERLRLRGSLGRSWRAPENPSARALLGGPAGDPEGLRAQTRAAGRRRRGRGARSKVRGRPKPGIGLPRSPASLPPSRRAVTTVCCLLVWMRLLPYLARGETRHPPERMHRATLLRRGWNQAGGRRGLGSGRRGVPASRWRLGPGASYPGSSAAPGADADACHCRTPPGLVTGPGSQNRLGLGDWEAPAFCRTNFWPRSRKTGRRRREGGQCVAR